jgi:uncharacterized protein (TIGR02266 family)
MSMNAAAANLEGRNNDRYDLSLEVTAHSGHQFFTGFTENISAGGLFVATYQTMELGSRFEMTFTIPGVEYEFKVKCDVRWVREYNETMPNMQPGMGVRFVDLTPTETQILNELLSRTDTLFFDEEL